MASSRRTWCRVCGTELRLPWWKAVVGLDHAVCQDAFVCVTRFRATRLHAVVAGQRRTAQEQTSWTRLRARAHG
jgi:hypothetical protein